VEAIEEVAMSSVRSSFLCLIAGLGLLGGASYLFPGLAAGFDPGSLSELLRKMQEEGLRSDQLDAEGEAALARLAAKQEAVEAVIAGRLTVAEAAARFRSLDEAWPKFKRDEFRRSQPGATDDERYRNAVVEYVRQVLQDRSGAGRDVLLAPDSESAALLHASSCTPQPAMVEPLRGSPAGDPGTSANPVPKRDGQ
jgi:hypothetical protein